MDTKELSIYLEKIRYDRGMSQANFCRGIVSIRQYQRYKIGLSEIPHEKIDAFAEKLGINAKKLFSDFENEKQIQGSKISNYYNYVANKDNKSANILKEQIKEEFIITEDNRKYYKYTIAVQSFYSNEMKKEELSEILAKLVNYPEILDQEYSSDIDILILSFMLNVVKGTEQDKILHKLDMLFKQSNHIITNNSEYIYSLILMRMARLYGMRRNLSSVIYYCNMGIERGLKYRQYYLWDYFYYYKSLAYYALGRIKEYEDSLLNCYNILMLEHNDSKTKKFLYLIEKDYEIDFHSFVVEVVKNRKLIRGDS